MSRIVVEERTLPDIQWEGLCTLSRRLRAAYRAFGARGTFQIVNAEALSREEWEIILGRFERRLARALVQVGLREFSCEGWTHIRTPDGNLRSFRVSDRTSSWPMVSSEHRGSSK